MSRYRPGSASVDGGCRQIRRPASTVPPGPQKAGSDRGMISNRAARCNTYLDSLGIGAVYWPRRYHGNETKRP